MAGYKETFGANVDYAYGRGVTDLTSRLNRGISGAGDLGKGISGFASQMSGAKRGVSDLATEMRMLEREMKAATDPERFLSLARQMDNAKKSAEKLRKQMVDIPFQAMEKGLKKVLDGLISFNTGILDISFNFLIDSIKRVYELQERWTKAIGGFNMKIGGMTKGIAGAQKAAVQWSSTIRSLTNGDINEGIQMFADFTQAIGRTVKAGDQFSKIGIQIARGFGVGGQGAGQIVKVWEDIGMNADDANEAMKTSIKSANQAGIPVNMLADDISKSITYMARFGKEGQKTLIQGAAWARKYDIALEQLKTSVEGFDAFDDAAKSASKLNTAFGTMINSMDLMMEDDPAKRLDMIRQEMLSQGLTYDKLTPKQRRYFSETMKLSEEQTASLLDAKNANESYTDFAAKAAAKEKKELSAKEMMQKQLQATTQTMYAFGMAFDRITKAIANAIKPLLVVLGLAKDSDKKFTSFGQVMESVTTTVEDFFKSLAKNDKWMGFMRELGTDLQRAGTALKNFVMSGGAARLVGDIADGMKSFYTTVRDLAIKAVPMLRPLMDALLFLSKHIKAIALAWAGMKAINMGRGIVGSLGGMGSGMGGAVGKAGMGMAAGGAAGALLGGTGAEIGGLVGGIAGPVAGVVGAGVGKIIEKLWTRYDKMSEAEEQRGELERSIKREQEAHEAQTKMVDAMTAVQHAKDMERQEWSKKLTQLDKEAHKSKKGEIELTDADVESLHARADELMAFSSNTKATSKALEEVFKPGGAAHVSADALDILQKAAGEAGSKMSDLAKQAADLEKAHEGELAESKLGKLEASTKIAAQIDEAKAKAERAKYNAMGGGISGLGKDYKGGLTSDEIVRMGLEGKGPWAKLTKEQQERIKQGALVEKLEEKVVKDKMDLNNLEAKHNEELYRIQLRQLLMNNDAYKAFAASPAEQGLSPDSILDDWLQDPKNKQAIISEYGDTVYDAATSKGLIPRDLAGHSVTANTRLPVATTNLATPAVTGGGGASVSHTVADVHLDGQKVGRAIVRTTIRGRD